jgi:nitric oxide reductase NorE protein
MPSDSVSKLAPTRHVPGESGIWVFIMGDLLVFSLFFAVFVFNRAHDTALYRASESTLSSIYGALNTLLLLTSSWFVVLAMNGVRRNLRTQAALLFALAFFCGAGFSAVKILEYGEKLKAGIGLTTNDFYMYYFILTGLHFVHVVIGMVVLLFLGNIARKGIAKSGDLVVLECGASYWHMVDVLWLILFPLLYLIK